MANCHDLFQTFDGDISIDELILLNHHCEKGFVNGLKTTALITSLSFIFRAP
jgi:hypothetical protein